MRWRAWRNCFRNDRATSRGNEERRVSEQKKSRLGIVTVEPSTQQYFIVSNLHKAYIAPAGQGFLPRATAWYHQKH